jgi:hypothetical protein
VITLSVEDDAPPLVRATREELAARLEDPAFAEATGGLHGVVGIRTPGGETATLRIADEAISVAHGVAGDADLVAEIELDRIEGGMAALSGEAEHPRLAQWLRALLDRSAVAWPDAGDRFWAVLTEMPGAPAALRVVDTEGREERRWGAADGRAYEIHGAPDDLSAVLVGRAALIDAAFEGRVHARGSFPELSVLTGAGLTLRYGGTPADG